LKPASAIFCPQKSFCKKSRKRILMFDNEKAMKKEMLFSIKIGFQLIIKVTVLTGVLQLHRKLKKIFFNISF
jgi:hypothetical protein